MSQQPIKAYRFGPFLLDLEERALLRNGKAVYLQQKTLEILVVLIETSGHVVSKDELMTKVWPDTFVEESNLTHHISTIRKALSESPDDERYIKTVPRRGYRFVATVVEATDGDTAHPDERSRREHAGSMRSQGKEKARARLSPVQPAGSTPNNLRLRATPLIGREAEIQVVMSRIRRDDVRLLSLVGGPGVGKTCLVIEAARALLSEFPDGVFLVELAPIRDPGLAASAIASVLGLKESGTTPITETLKEHLSGKRLLLALDNFEHVLPAALLIAELLAMAPEFKVLATSRESLGLSWEHLYEVPALAVPHSKVDASSPVLQQNPAVALLLQTACRVKSDFAISPLNAPSVAQICRRLQGVPLAIELVAAHVNDMSPEEMMARPDGGMTLLARGPRDAPPRHETMGRAIDWSYDLLDEEEKRFFRRLSIFIGGFTLEAAEFVCGPQESSRGSALQRLTSLKNKSLVVRRNSTGQSRFTMLEVIREYGVERLAASGEELIVRRKHAEFFRDVAEISGARLQGETLPATLDGLETEIGNLRAALQWSVDRGDAETGLRIASPLRRFWHMRDHTSEARSWLKSLLSIDAEVPILLRARALGAAAVLAEYQADFRLAPALIAGAVDLVRDTGDRVGTAELLKLQGDALIRQEDYCGALPLLEESLSIYRGLGSDWHVAATLNSLWCVAIQFGDYQKSIALCERSLILFEELKDKRCVAVAANNMAFSMIKMGRFEEALAYLRRSLLLAQEVADSTSVLGCFGTLTGLACGRGQFEYAALLLSLDAACRAVTNLPRQPCDVSDYEAALATARSALSPDDFKAAWEQGQGMSVEEGVAYILSELC